jgi:hypothetical protein
VANDFELEMNDGISTSFHDVDTILADRKPLYIKNKTTQPIRLLVIDYPSPEGPKAFFIPRTPIPFNICDFVDPESLRSSSSFRSMLNAQAIEVIDIAAAKAVIADPEARKSFVSALNEANKTHQHRANELAKTREANAAYRDEQSKQNSGAMKNMLTAMDPMLAKALNITGADGMRPEPKLIVHRNARLAALEARVKAGTAALATIMSELSLMLGDLSTDDLQAIAGSAFWPPESQKWARDRIAYATKALNAKS